MSRILVILLLCLLLMPILIPAQPVRDRILGDLQISPSSEGTVVNVGFSFPIRYIKHFPYNGGEGLLIQLEPIVVPPVDRDAVFQRESIVPPQDNPAAVLQVIYEGDMRGGPFLSVLFRDPVTFDVRQGADFRSVVVVVTEGQAPAAWTQVP